MRSKIFINCRREGTVETAGRLYDRIAQAFGQENVFVDFLGADLKARLNNQVPMCRAFLTVIGPSWLEAKDEAGQHRIHSPDDFVALEIAAALAHNIPVMPVLVDGAHMPLMSELPESLEPLARRPPVEVRRLHFDRDAATLVERVREALDAPRRVRTLARAALAAMLVLLGASTYALIQHSLQADLRSEEEHRAADVETNRKAEAAGHQARAAAEAEISRKVEEAEKQRLATEQERLARAAADAEVKRKSEAAEQALVAAEQERQRRIVADADTEGQSKEAEQLPVAALGGEDEAHKR